VRDDQGAVWVVVKRVCEALGLDRAGQVRRIEGDGALRWRRTSLPSAGGPQEAFCIHADDLHAWLAGIEAGKVTKTP
jgi:prophage antirepressor-like protein